MEFWKWLQLFLNFALISLTTCLYEDQVGKFDWSQHNIGPVSHVLYDAPGRSRGRSAKLLTVASEQNVVAGVSLVTGKLAWRHVLEETDKLTNLLQTSNGVVCVSTKEYASNVRLFDPSNGLVYFQKSLPFTALSVIVHDELIIISGSEQVTALSLKSGAEMFTVEKPWGRSVLNVFMSSSVDDNCVYVIVVDHDSERLSTFKLLTTTSDEISEEQRIAELKLTDNQLVTNPRCVGEGPLFACSLNLAVYLFNLKTNTKKLVTTIKPAVHDLKLSGEYLLLNLQSGNQDQSVVYKISSADLEKSKVQFEGHGVIVTKDDMSLIMSVKYSQKGWSLTSYTLPDGRESDWSSELRIKTEAEVSSVYPFLYTSTDGEISYRLLTVHDDYSIHVLKRNGDELWVREEGLSSLVSVQMIDLPVSETEAQMDEEFGHSAQGNIVTQVISRLTSQFMQLVSSAEHMYHKYVIGLRVIGETQDHMILDEDYLTRDAFGLHKMIVAVSDNGKLFGVDSYTGKIIWSYFIPNIKPYNNNKILLYIQRTTAHFPKKPIATILAQQCMDTCKSVVLSFDPISGPVSTDKLLELQYTPLQVINTNMREDFIRPIIILDQQKQIHIIPSDKESYNTPITHSLHLFTAEPKTSSLTGYLLRGETLGALEAVEVWNVNFNEKLLSLNTRYHKDQVHSLGKVLSDRTVLYKYNNPNLISLFTESGLNTNDPRVTARLNVYLLDAVTGRIIYSCSHKSVAPVYSVLSDNWVVYSRVNLLYNRTEVSVLELYEGIEQSNSTVFSSLENNIDPIVMSQAYVLGTHISALATTYTEKGISGKDILFARTVGGIVEVQKNFLDPRRPDIPDAQSQQEGIPPYIPELPLSYDHTINYNSSVYRIKHIDSEPSSLESTTLILARGLDLFFTQISPSQKYDMLKDDFDYLFISAVTIGMIVASFAGKYFASRQAVRRAWK